MASETKKMKYNEGPKSDKPVDSVASLGELRSDKFGLLLPVVYPLNKSRCKSVIVGIKVDYEKSSGQPVVGIIDQKFKGVLLAEEAWQELVKCFVEIQEYFHFNTKKFGEQPNKPVTHTGFSLTYTTMGFGATTSKVIRIEECVSSGVDHHLDKSPSIMQEKTFNFLHEAETLISDYLKNLRELVPCVESCITTLSATINTELGNIKSHMNIQNLHSEVIRHIVRNSMLSGDCWRKSEDVVRGLKSTTCMLNFKRIMNELILYHSEFLTRVASN